MEENQGGMYEAAELSINKQLMFQFQKSLRRRDIEMFISTLME